MNLGPFCAAKTNIQISLLKGTKDQSGLKGACRVKRILNFFSFCTVFFSFRVLCMVCYFLILSSSSSLKMGKEEKIIQCCKNRKIVQQLIWEHNFKLVPQFIPLTIFATTLFEKKISKKPTCYFVTNSVSTFFRVFLVPRNRPRASFCFMQGSANKCHSWKGSTIHTAWVSNLICKWWCFCHEMS